MCRHREHGFLFQCRQYQLPLRYGTCKPCTAGNPEKHGRNMARAYERPSGFSIVRTGLTAADHEFIHHAVDMA